MKQEMYDTWDIISLLILGAICGFLICLFLLVAKPSSSTEVWIAVSSVGTVTIPLVLFWWGRKSEENKEKREQERREREEIESLILPCFPNLSLAERKKLNPEAYRDILLDLYQNLHLVQHNLPNFSPKYQYLKDYITECFMFLMPVDDLPIKNYEFYDACYAVSSTYLKRDMRCYIYQGCLAPDWKERFQNHNTCILKYRKGTAK